MPICAAPIRDGAVQIVGERLGYVGRAADAPRDPQQVELRDALLMPGLINAHTHLELQCYAGQIPPSPFWSWIERLVVLRRAPDQVQRESAAAEQGAWLSLRAGVTCVGDISRRNVAWPALSRVPIRKVCFVELLSLADHAPRNPDELRQGLESVAEDTLLTAGVSPHAPYTVPRDEIRAAVRLARERQRPWCTHWAETREEVAFLSDTLHTLEPPLPLLFELIRERGITSPRCDSVAYLLASTQDGNPGGIAHLNYVRDDELAALAAAGHVAMYCPRAHRFFGHEPHPFERMLQAGVRVAIATDSPASNTSVSLLDELRFVRCTLQSRLQASKLLEMVTIDAAEALCLSSQVGTLAVGKFADLAAFPLAAPASMDPLVELIERAPSPCGVWVAGKQVCP